MSWPLTLFTLLQNLSDKSLSACAIENWEIFKASMNAVIECPPKSMQPQGKTSDINAKWAFLHSAIDSQHQLFHSTFSPFPAIIPGKRRRSIAGKMTIFWISIVRLVLGRVAYVNEKKREKKIVVRSANYKNIDNIVFRFICYVIFKYLSILPVPLWPNKGFPTSVVATVDPRPVKEKRREYLNKDPWWPT